ncbi:hypothetical protein GT348_04750 [Aristophania vespae]|uniref:VTT domain-containing protein n=1 Tax=Aristophania vespae TaxID=2697033 RepID=A0A6P1NDZ7_9PROT|nr:VTT domain-containing protein [Aristophania vespae]QHI95663.1 hypothetical protein GT348_04750 [Aristophania vespae]
MFNFTSFITSQSAWVKALSIIIGTFILEDVATVLTAIATQAHEISIILGLVSLYIGIAVGDVGLYGLGWAGAKWPRVKRFLTLPSQKQTQKWFDKNVIKIVGISRFVPGARLPLYTACGFYHAPFWLFTVTAVFATLIWTSFLFYLSLHIGGWLLAHKSGWRWAGLAGFVLCIFVIGRLIAHFQKVSR